MLEKSGQNCYDHFVVQNNLGQAAVLQWRIGLLLQFRKSSSLKPIFPSIVLFCFFQTQTEVSEPQMRTGKNQIITLKVSSLLQTYRYSNR